MDRHDAEHATGDPDQRAAAVERAMTDDERFTLVYSLFVELWAGAGREPRVPEDVPVVAGYMAGIPRLGIPALLMSDASLGIANPQGARPGDTATALPCGMVIGATFDPELAREAGALVGREAASRGFNVLLGGGMNLVRDPRCGRNFEYLSEDPWHTGLMASEAVLGTQAQRVISTVKHLSLNANEANRHWLDAVIDPEAHRESDLLAFEIAIERGRPGSIMGAYNKLNGEYCCGNAHLLNDIVKGLWGFPGWIMSDWMATHGWEFALHGLDQQCGTQLDRQEWFVGPLREAHARGEFPAERLSDMVRRILRSIYAVGADEPGPAPEVDLDAHHAIALRVARQGCVLLRNEGALLPLGGDVTSVAVIGGWSRFGVPAGGGSSLVTPIGGFVDQMPLAGDGPIAKGRSMPLSPSAPFDELRKVLPSATFRYSPGAYPADAAAIARQCDVAIVFAVSFESEGYDAPDLSLPFGQDTMIGAVAAANPRTVVVLETGNPCDMPWHDQVPAILQAWYPGQAGAQAIAEILVGRVNPSGRLPVTFPAAIDDTPRPEAPGLGDAFGTAHTVVYHEGAEVGYRWFAQQGLTPRYAFGHGLSYTRFEHRDLSVTGGDTVTASVRVTNTGAVPGADVVQVYLTDAPSGPRLRLLGFQRVELAPGESATVTVEAEPRLLARFRDGAWHVEGGSHRVVAARSATDHTLAADVELTARSFGR